MLCFKATLLRHEFDTINPRLRAILFELSDYLERRFGVNSEKSILLITSLWRLQNKDSVHAYGRGADLAAKIFNLGNLYEILSHMNDNFPYGDDKHETLKFHSRRGYLEDDVGVMDDDDFHAHVQVIELK